MTPTAVHMKKHPVLGDIQQKDGTVLTSQFLAITKARDAFMRSVGGRIDDKVLSRAEKMSMENPRYRDALRNSDFDTATKMMKQQFIPTARKEVKESRRKVKGGEKKPPSGGTSLPGLSIK